MHGHDDVRIFQRYCRALRRHGYDVTLVTSVDRDTMVDGVVVLGVGLRKGFWRHFYSSAICWYRAIRTKADWYHFHDPDLLPLGVVLKSLGYSVLYDVHEDFAIRLQEWLPGVVGRVLGHIYRMIENSFAVRLDAIVAVSKSMVEIFPERKSCARFVVRNVPDLERVDFSALEILASNRNSLIVVSGVQAPNRDTKRIVEALPLIQSMHSNARVLLVGEFSPPRYQAEIVDLARTLGVEKSITIEGRLTWEANLERIAQAAVGCVLLKNDINSQKALPNRLFDYMICRVPVVVENMPEVARVVRQADCGIVLSDSTPRAIADAIIEILNRPSVGRRYGENGHKAILTHYNFPYQIRPLEELYLRARRR